jgi:hypothetical protein
MWQVKGGSRRRRPRQRATWRITQSLGLLAALAGLVTALTVTPSRPAAAAPAPKVRTAASYYIQSTDPGRAYDLGCAQGLQDAKLGRTDTSVFLAFGGQNAANTGTMQVINGTFMSYATIARVAVAFAHGYWVCTSVNHQARLFLSLGTNNSAFHVDRAGGIAWGRLVNGVRDFVQANFGQVVIQGGNDIEPDWSGYPDALSWIAGYSDTTTQPYLNFGSADGCPTDTADNGGCNNGWTQANLWYVSYGHPHAIAAPEIYYPVQARQWHMIAMYGALHKGTPPRYLAPLDQYPADPTTFSAQQAWSALSTEMNSSVHTAGGFPFSMEVKYQ